jgi:hypothetical protein
LRKHLNRRGVSEVLGAILIAVIVMGMSATYVTLEASRSKAETMSVVDLIRAAERKQRQLLSLIYYYKQGNNLKLYFYNYGSETSTPKLILADQEVVFWRTVWTFEWFEVTDSSGRFGSKLGESTYAGESYTFNWGGGEVYGGRSDCIGYVAKTVIYFKGLSTVTICTDDGMEVYIDGQSVFNGAAWHLQGPTPYQQTVSLSPGTHEVVTKWYEWSGGAYSSFSATNVAPHSSISMKNMNTGATCETIPPKTLVEVTMPAPASSSFDFLMLTVEEGVFSWKLTV